MKKTIVLFALIISLLCVCACGGSGSGSFTDLNDMAKQNYSIVERTVKTMVSGETLTSRFTVRNGDVVEIDYSLEQLNKIDINNMPDEYKTVKTGVVKLNGTEVTEQTGDEVDVNFAAMTKVNLDFVEEYFAQVKWSNGKMTANVSNAQGFLGSDVYYVWMTVTAEYSKTLNKVTVDYLLTNGVEVQLTYAFTA